MSGSKALDSGLFRVLKKSAAYCAAAAIMLTGGVISASAANTDGAAGTAVVDEDSCESSLPQMTFKAETKFSNGNTHPFGYQTSKLKVRWDKVSGAKGYQLCIKGGKYSSWMKFKTISPNITGVTLKGLSRNTAYKFRIRALDSDGTYGDFSEVQTLRTGRIDFDEAGWKAMCRIVYHEVGQSSDECWDEPIVHVADCVVNRYEAAKYLNDPLWEPYYRGYNSVQSMIYNSGGFMSDAGLAADGATYSNVTSKVKLAVYGTVYSKVTVKNIKHNKNVFYWQNTSYKPTGSKVAYVYPIPWGGYFSIWKEYWG